MEEEAATDPADELSLVARAQSQDESAWPELIRRYEGAVRGVARGVVNAAGFADEVAHDTFVTAWFKLGTLERLEAFAGWIKGIARNKALELSRDKRFRGARLNATQHPELPAETGSLRDRKVALYHDVMAVIHQLPAPYRELLLQRYFDKTSCRELSERTGRPLGTITKQLSRAHALVAEVIARRGGHTTTLAGWVPASLLNPGEVAP